MADPIAAEEMAEEVRRGLEGDPKELPPKFFYDTRGSELFEAITRLPEYYLTRAEISILEAEVAPLVGRMAPACLVELAAGSGRKTRILLEAMLRENPDGTGEGKPCYVPVDVSGEFLEASAAETRARFPGLSVRPLVSDMTRPGFLDGWTRDRFPSGDGPTLFAFLGSTIGNFRKEPATALLAAIRGAMGPADALLLGVDLAPGPGKTVERLEAAYDDSRGVTAEFNRNVLRVLNREVGTDFDLEAFRHEAFWVPGDSRIEMHLVARSAQEVTLPGGGRASFQEGESVRTEISSKYEQETVAELLDGAGLVRERWMSGADGSDGDYAVVLARPSGGKRHGP